MAIDDGLILAKLLITIDGPIDDFEGLCSMAPLITPLMPAVNGSINAPSMVVPSDETNGEPKRMESPNEWRAQTAAHLYGSKPVRPMPAHARTHKRCYSTGTFDYP